MTSDYEARTADIALLGNPLPPPSHHAAFDVADGRRSLKPTATAASLSSLSPQSAVEALACKRRDGKKRRAYRSILLLIRKQLMAAAPPPPHSRSPSRNQTAITEMTPLSIDLPIDEQAPEASTSSTSSEPSTSSTEQVTQASELVSSPSQQSNLSSSAQRTTENGHVPQESSAEQCIEQLRLSEDAALIPRTDDVQIAMVLRRLAPAVYEDPFCAVTADGSIHISEYYLTSNSPNNVTRLSNHHERSSKSIRVSEVSSVYHARASLRGDHNTVKTWGLTRNSVWWAADMTRIGSASKLHWNVVLCCESHPLLHGFTVVNVVAFLDALRACGLPDSSPISDVLPYQQQQQQGQQTTLQYIDETGDESANCGAEIKTTAEMSTSPETISRASHLQSAC